MILFLCFFQFIYSEAHLNNYRVVPEKIARMKNVFQKDFLEKMETFQGEVISRKRYQESCDDSIRAKKKKYEESFFDCILPKKSLEDIEQLFCRPISREECLKYIPPHEIELILRILSNIAERRVFTKKNYKQLLIHMCRFLGTRKINVLEFEQFSDLIEKHLFNPSPQTLQSSTLLKVPAPDFLTYEQFIEVMCHKFVLKKEKSSFYLSIKWSWYLKQSSDTFNNHRSLGRYYRVFPTSLQAEIQHLEGEDIWLDAGSGICRATLECLKNQASLSMPLTQIICVSLESPEQPYQQYGDKFKLFNCPIEKVPLKDWLPFIGRVSIITDISGVFAYTKNPSALLWLYKALLRDRGKLFIYSCKSDGNKLQRLSSIQTEQSNNLDDIWRWIDQSQVFKKRPDQESNYPYGCIFDNHPIYPVCLSHLDVYSPLWNRPPKRKFVETKSHYQINHPINQASFLNGPITVLSPELSFLSFQPKTMA